MGFTLQEVLKYASIRNVEVVEIASRVVHWNRTLFRAVNGGVLADPRVRVVVVDVADYLFRSCGLYNAVILDTDNGPGNVIHPDNTRLYTVDMLRVIHGLLLPGGMLALWSMKREKWFGRRLRQVFAHAKVESVLSRKGGKTSTDYVYLGQR